MQYKFNLIKIFLFIFTLSNASLAQDKILRIYGWTDYIDINIIKKFVAKTGVKVEYDMYTSNEQMYKNIKQKDYDIIFPSTNYISKLKKDNLIKQIDKNRLKNFKNLDKNMLSKELYSLPYFWGTTGIVYDYIDLGFKITKWDDLWDTRLRNKLAISEDMTDMFSISLKSLGYSANSQNKEEIEKAYLKLLKLIPNVKTIGSNIKIIGSEDLENDFINEHVHASISYSGDVVELIGKNKELKYVFPKEGALKWMDNIVILKETKNEEIAYDFLDFLLLADISKQNAKTIGYATPNINAKKTLDKQILKNRIIYPTKNDLKNSEYQIDIENSYQIYSQYWNKFLQQLKEGGNHE